MSTCNPLPAAVPHELPLRFEEARQLLPQAYALLAELLRPPQHDHSYNQALTRVLHAAQASEAAGFPLALLPLLTCQAAGGDPRSAIPVAAAWRALHIGLKLLDDVEDGDVARMNAGVNPAQVLNLSTGFLAAAQLALTHLPAAQCHVLQADFLQTVLRMARGQHVDLDRSTARSIQTYFQVMEAKSGAFFALAAASGSKCATTDCTEIAKYQDFGYNVGILIQIVDDWSDIALKHGQGDLTTGQATLAVCYAQTVASPAERVHLESLLACAPTSAAAEHEARHLLTTLGCEMYMQAELARYRRRSLAVFDGAGGLSSAVRPLHDWFVALYSSAN
ncbi:MAG TPA: polyprenyl synthetase family protein [Herpetosiphonaceae bacterium]